MSVPTPRLTIYAYDQSGGFTDASDYLFKAEAQPEGFDAGQFVVGYSDESEVDAVAICKAACRKVGYVGEFAVETEEENE